MKTTPTHSASSGQASPAQAEPTAAELATLHRINERYLKRDGQNTAGALHEFNQGFPEIYLDARLAFPAQVPMHVQILASLDRWLEGRAAGKRRPGGVVLSGQVGTGKTHLACLVAKEAAALANIRTSFVSCRRMRKDLRDLYEKRERSRRDYVQAADALEWPLVVLDDVGAEAGNPEAVDLVRDIIDERTQADCFTIATCNKTQPGFDEHLGNERDISRARVLEWIQFTPDLPDYRSIA